MGCGSSSPVDPGPPLVTAAARPAPDQGAPSLHVVSAANGVASDPTSTALADDVTPPASDESGSDEEDTTPAATKGSTGSGMTEEEITAIALAAAGGEGSGRVSNGSGRRVSISAGVLVDGGHHVAAVSDLPMPGTIAE